MKAGLGSEVDIGLDSAGGSGRTPFAAPAPEDVARLFSQLEILGFIGQGGMDAVYKARQKALDRVVALKILPPGIGKEPAFAERFTREAKALAKLNHTGIVTLYEFGQADGQFFFLMEFVDGVNLRDLLEAGRVSPREALAIVPQLCDALQYAHDQGIVHRDIKPENILLDRQGRVKVADFGLAKLVGPEALIPALSHPTGGGASAPGEGTPPSAALTDVGKVMGTPQYMAPEQREHPTEMDHRADIYSLGVVFYQMLTVELPGKPIEPPSRKVQIDVRLDEVVLRALEKKPALRYQQVSEVKTCVETILGSAGGPPAEPGAALGATVNKSGFVRLFETFSVRAFTSPLAIKLINVSALGFLGALAFLRFVALPGMEYCIGFAGFFFFFGLIGLAFMAEMANRRKAKQTTGSLPLFVEHAGRRRLYWPGVLLFCGTLGLVVFGVNLAIALALWLLNAPVRLTFQPGELLLVCILMAACVIMRLAALKLGSSEVARAGSAPATKVSAARKVLLAFLAVAVAFAVAAGLGIGIMVLAWMWTSAKTPPSAAALISAASPLSRPVTTESPNSVLEVRNGGPRTSIRAELDDAHELRVFIGGEALGWSVRPAGATSVIATVEVSSGLRFPDGNNWGRELIFEAWRVRHTNSVNTGSPNRHYRGVGLRQNGRIVNDKGTFTFADIRQTNGTLIPVSIRVRPVPVNAVGDNSAPEAAKLKLDQTQAEFARIRELYDGKLVSQSDYEAAQLAKDLAVAELKGDAVEVARLRLQSAQTNLARMKELYERKLVSESDYAAAQLVKDVAEEKLTRETDAAKDPTKVPSNQPTQSTPAGA